jgi:hypothetical protein
MAHKRHARLEAFAPQTHFVEQNFRVLAVQVECSTTIWQVGEFFLGQGED